MRDFLRKLLNGSSKVIGQKVDKELRLVLCEFTQHDSHKIRKDCVVYLSIGIIEPGFPQIGVPFMEETCENRARTQYRQNMAAVSRNS